MLQLPLRLLTGLTLGTHFDELRNIHLYESVVASILKLDALKNVIFLCRIRPCSLQSAVRPLEISSSCSLQTSQGDQQRFGGGRESRWRGGGVVWKQSHPRFCVLQRLRWTQQGSKCDQQKTDRVPSTISELWFSESPCWEYCYEWRAFFGCMIAKDERIFMEIGSDITQK